MCTYLHKWWHLKNLWISLAPGTFIHYQTDCNVAYITWAEAVEWKKQKNHNRTKTSGGGGGDDAIPLDDMCGVAWGMIFCSRTLNLPVCILDRQNIYKTHHIFL